jgi:hypothetical protein
VEQVLISRSELDYYWAYAYTQELSWDCRDKLATEKPGNSAKTTISFFQKLSFFLLAVGIIIGVSLNALKPPSSANLIVQISYFCMIVSACSC